MLPDAALAYYQQQQKIGVLTAATTAKALRRMTADFDSSWGNVRTTVLSVLVAGQLGAAQASVGYVDNVLAETGQDGGAVLGAVAPAAFAGFASDGRDLGTLADQAPIIAKATIGRGGTVTDGLQAASKWLSLVALTQVADASRGFVAADMGAHSNVTGYIRVLTPPSCSRCVVLAGKRFRYNQGFQRHPGCDCKHQPLTDDVPDDYTTDPYAYFRSLTKAQQEATFGRIEARAINDGADIYRVVNLGERGMPVAGSKQAIKYGTPRKLTVDQIYRTAGTRARAVQAMKDEGYITGPQIAGGNILGQREGFGQLGKGGKARAASDAVSAARRLGVRDPLNRYTMTAAERDLYDAKTRLDAAEKQGVLLRSIGANSADKFNPVQRVTPEQLATLRKDYTNVLAKARKNIAHIKRTAPGTTTSLERLARALGIAL